MKLAPSLVMILLAVWAMAAVAQTKPVAPTKAVAGAKPATEPKPAAEKNVVTLAWFPAFSPDGKWLVTPHGSWRGNEAGEARVWNVETGEVKHVIPSPAGVRTVAWSPKGTFIASGNYRGDLRIYDPETTDITLALQTPPGGTIEVVQISPDEQLVIGSSRTGQVHIWDLKAKKLKTSFPAHVGDIWGMRLSANGKTLATAGKDNYVRIWDLTTNQLLHELKHPGQTNGVDFTKDASILATGCTDGKIRFFDVKSGKELVALSGHGGGIPDLNFSSDDKLLASSGSDRTVRLWDVAKKQELATWEGHTANVFGAVFSYDDKLVASGSWDNTIRVWEVPSGKLVHELKR